MTETPVTTPPTEAEKNLLAKVAHLGAQIVDITSDEGTRRAIKFARNTEGDAGYLYVD